MICEHCGMENEEGVEICAFCGEEIQMDEEQPLAGIIEQAKVEEMKQERIPSKSDRPGSGDAKMFVAVAGCGLVLIALITVASFFLLKTLLSNASDWWEGRPTAVFTTRPTSVATTHPVSVATTQTTSVATTQSVSVATTQPTSVATNQLTSVVTIQPTSIATIQPTAIYQPQVEAETLFYGIRSEAVYRPFTSIGILTLDSLEQEIIMAEPNGLLPIMMSPEAGQSLISPDRKSVVLTSGYQQAELFIFRVGNPNPVYEIDGHPDLGPFHRFSPDGKYFTYPSRDLQTSEFILNFLDLENGVLYKQPGLLYGIFLADANQAIGFRVSPSEEKLISIDQIDFLNNQTTSLQYLDLSLDDILYIPPFLSQDGEFVFYLDGDFLMSFSIPNREIRTVYKFQYVAGARAFLLHQSDIVIILDGLDPEVADLHVYHPQTEQLVNIDRRVSATAYYFDPRNFANVPPIAISTDGTRIAYGGGLLGEMELRIAQLGGSDIIPLSNRVYFISFEFSPDNQKIAYIEFTVSSQYGDLYITDLKGKERQLLDNNVISFEFISNGAEIVYSKFDSPEEGFSKSLVYKIGVNVEKKEFLLEKDGAFVFIHMP